MLLGELTSSLVVKELGDEDVHIPADSLPPLALARPFRDQFPIQWTPNYAYGKEVRGASPLRIRQPTLANVYKQYSS
jgi:hypothetical protein